MLSRHAGFLATAELSCLYGTFLYERFGFNTVLLLADCKMLFAVIGVGLRNTLTM